MKNQRQGAKASRRRVKVRVWSVIGSAVAGTSLLTPLAHASGSASWLASPTNSNWVPPSTGNNKNWNTGNHQYPGSTSGTTNTDIATFNMTSSQTSVVMNNTINVQNITFDTSSASAYTIGTTSGNALLLTNGGTIQNTSTDANTQTVNAPLVLEGASGTYAFTSGSSNNAMLLNFGGGITAGASGATVLTLNGSNTGNNTIGGIIANGSATSLGITKSGAGTWLLNNANTYTGPTIVSAGTLLTANATALGSGNVNVTGGTLNVGNGSPQNLNLSSGTYTQGSGGTLTLQVNNSSTGNYSSLQTTGTASLNGTLNLNVTGSGPAADDTQFQVLNTGTRSGVFSGYTTNLAAGKAFDTSRVEKTGKLSVVSYFNGFENVNGTWANNSSTFGASVNSYVLGASPVTPGHAVQVVNAAAASSNAAYGKLTTTPVSLSLGGQFPATANVGPLTRFNGNSGSFGTGFTTQADIYIDPAWTGDSNGTGFDYSSAVSDTSGNFHRDFILHVFKSGGTLYAAASNNSDYKPDPNYASIANKLAITTAGWYTVQDTFRNNSGTLAVDVKLFNSGGTSPIYSQTLSAPADAISGIGGNNYAWFVNIDTGTGANNYLNVDNVKLVNNTGSGLSAPAVTSGTLLLGNASVDGSTTPISIGGVNPGAVTNGYDRVDVTQGTATLSGNLNVGLVNGFEDQITPADQFVVLSADHMAGAFNNVSNGGRVTTSNGSGSFQTNYQTVGGATQLVLSDFQAIPEPSMLMPAVLGALGLWVRRRKPRASALGHTGRTQG